MDEINLRKSDFSNMRMRLTQAEEQNEVNKRLKTEGQNQNIPLYQSVANLQGEKYLGDRFEPNTV